MDPSSSVPPVHRDTHAPRPITIDTKNGLGQADLFVAAICHTNLRQCSWFVMEQDERILRQLEVLLVTVSGRSVPENWSARGARGGGRRVAREGGSLAEVEVGIGSRLQRNAGTLSVGNESQGVSGSSLEH